MSQPADIYDQLASGLRAHTRDEIHNNGSGLERFAVSRLSPLILDQIDGDLTLEDGDPDVTIGAWVRQCVLQYPLAVGDQVWCVREGSEWHAVDVADPGGQSILLKRPAGNGVAGQFLQTDGAGGVTWASAAPGASSLTSRAYRNAALTLAASAATKIPLDTISFDTAGAISTANGRFVAPVAGYYLCHGQVGTTTADAIQAALYKNGAPVAVGNYTPTGYAAVVSDTIQCNAGDTIELWCNNNTAGADPLNLAGGQTNFLDVTLAAGLPGATGTTTVARARRAGALTILGNTKIPVDTVATGEDPGGCFDVATNHRYNVPATGFYQVNGQVGVQSPPANNILIAMIYVNGGERSRGTRTLQTGDFQNATVSDIVRCNAGDTIELWAFSSNSLAMDLGSMEGYLSVVQVGTSMNFTTAGGDLAGSYPNPSIKPIVWHSLAYATGAGTGNWGDYATDGTWGPAKWGIDAMGFCHVRGLVKNATGFVYSPPSNLLIATGLPIPSAGVTTAGKGGTYHMGSLQFADTVNNHGTAYCYINLLGQLSLGGADWGNSGGNNGLMAFGALIFTPYPTTAT